MRTEILPRPCVAVLLSVLVGLGVGRTLAGEAVKPLSLHGQWLFSPSHDPRFAQPEWKEEGWLQVEVPKPLKGQHPSIKAGNGWYRKRLALDATLAGADLVFASGAINGTCAVYFNGTLIGHRRGRSRRTRYLVPARIVRAPGENVLAIRVLSRNGIERGPVQLGAADEKAKQEIVSEYVRSDVRFSLEAPPLADPSQKAVKIRVRLENPEPFNPIVDAAKGELILRRAESEPAVRRPVSLTPGRAQSFDLSVPLEEGEWEAALVVQGQTALSQKMVCLNYRRPQSGVVVDPHSQWVKDAKGRQVTLFAGPPPPRALGPVARKRPVIANLTSAILWDDYYLPSRQDGHFVAQFARKLPGGADVVDASFQGLPLLVLPELHRAALAARPDVIILSVGEHEHYFSPSHQEFERAFDAIVRTLQASTTARLILVTPPPALKDRAISRPFDEATKRIAKAHRLPLIDSAQLFDAQTKNLEELYDRLCPSESAHTLVADALAKLLPPAEIQKILARKDHVPAQPAPEGKSLTLIDGRMPASADVSGNTEWGPIAGRQAHWHAGNQKQSEHNFMNGDPSLVPEGATLVQEILLDSEPKPKAIMLVFRSSERNRDAQGINYFHRHSYNHGLFWGEDVIRYGKPGTPSRVPGGKLPPAAGWATLEIDAATLGLVGRYADGIRFVTFGGTARWGRTLLRTKTGERVWINGSFPVAAGRGRSWQWVPAPGRPGKLAHRAVDPSAERSYHRRFRTRIPLLAGATLRQWVYLPEGQEPSRIALITDGRHRRYWGRLKAYDRPGNTWIYAGPLPPAGRWTLLEVPLGTMLDRIGFLTWTGVALWGATEVVGVDPKFTVPDGFHCDYPTSQSPDPANLSTTAMGNQFFLGQTPRICVTLSNPAAKPMPFRGELQIADTYGTPVRSTEVQCPIPKEGLEVVEVACENLGLGFYRVRLVSAAGDELCSTTMSVLPRHVNFLDKQVFVYSNSGYVVEQLRLFDVLGGKWCRSIAVEQEMFRIEAFDTSPARNNEGTEDIVTAYRLARENATRKKSSPHHTQYWFNISSDEVNLKWHNLERWSEVIRAVTIGLKQSDPNCIVSTPEINSIAMGLLEKLGENYTFDYLDLYFSTGCSLPVPPECMNKYWSFDIDALAMIEERFGRRLTLTGMQYSTGNIGRAWGVHEEHQAAYYVRGDLLRRARDVDYISYFKFRESQNVNIYEVKDAINHADLTPKPAFVALASNFAKMDRSRYRGRLLIGRGNYAYLFEGPRGPILTLWTTEPVPQTVYLNLRAAEVTVTDLYGRARREKLPNGLLALTLTGDVQYVEGLGPAVAQESSFEPAPVLDPRDFAQRKLKQIFVAIENHRKDSFNFGDSRRDGRGDLVEMAGSTFPVRVNVYNFSLKPATIGVRLALPGGFVDRTGNQTCTLSAGSATTLVFTIQIPVERAPGLGKIRAIASVKGEEVDPFTTDILVRSPLEVLPLEAAPKAGTPIRVRFTNATDAPVDAVLRLELPFGWRTAKPTQTLAKIAPGDSAEASFVLAQAHASPRHNYQIAAFAKVGQVEAQYCTDLDFAAIQPTQHPVHLDGQLDEWFASAPLHYGQRSNDYIYNQLHQILDAENFSLRLRTLYDEHNLYLSLDVWDDQLCEEDTKHGLLWDLDSVQIDFDVDGDGKRDERVSVSCTGRSYIDPGDPRGDRAPMITGSKGLARVAARVFHDPTPTRPRGSVMELAIPWTYFQKKPFQPKPGARLGLHVFCVDEDVRAWSARPWKFDEGRKYVFVPFVLGTAVEGTTPSTWTARPRLTRRVFSRAPGDIAASKVSEAGLVYGPYTAGKAERFATTGLDRPDRATAQRLWFYGPGFIEYEYEIPGRGPTPRAHAVEFVAELSTCYRPGNTHYALPGNPTDVTVAIAGIEIGSARLLGDPGVDGWLVRLRVTESGTFHQGRRISQVTLKALLPKLKGKVRVRLTASGAADNPGGLNVHGPTGSGIHGIDPSLIVIREP